MKIKYEGRSHERSFTKADFVRHGIENQGAVQFDASNNWVAEVSDEAGHWLIENEVAVEVGTGARTPEFREATEEDETIQDMTRVGSTPWNKPPKSVADAISEGGTSSGEPAATSGTGGRRRGASTS